MCDCKDENNISSIPVGPIGPQGPAGPQGPQGPAGPSSVLSGESSTNHTIGTGVASFALDHEAELFIGQRARAASPDGTKIMEGEIISYTFPTLEIDVDYTEGVGTNNDWNIFGVGTRGATGATGATGPAGTTGQSAFTTMSAGVSMGSNLYRLTVTNSSWLNVDSYVYVDTAGAYKVNTIVSPTEIVVFNPGYSDNTPGHLVGSGLNLKVTATGQKGDAGTNGTNGFMYETVDGNGLPAQASGNYELLMRNADNTGYTFVTIEDLKILLNSIP